MRWTRAMSDLNAHSLERAWVLAFWVVVSALMCLAALLVLWLDLSSGLPLLAATSLFALAGWIERRIAAFVYRIWAGLARVFTDAATIYLLCVCFLLVTVVGWAGTTLRLARPSAGESLWEPTSASAAPALEDVSVADKWRDRIVSESTRDGNRWLRVLAPFLALVAALSTASSQEERDRQDQATYALY